MITFPIIGYVTIAAAAGCITFAPFALNKPHAWLLCASVWLPSAVIWGWQLYKAGGLR